jgi:phage terminase large subunit-like protein
LFGWFRADGTRRFRTGYVEIPRKNGKTTLAAGIGLQGLLADQEEGAEVYAAATMRDQACILFADAKRCLSKDLRTLVKEFQFAITFEGLHGTFRPLSSDHDTLDGLNPHRVVVDEFHAHKSRGLWDVLLGGQGARRQPLILAITTAGVDRHSICYEVREKLARAVLEGEADHNDSVFAFICCADETDPWDDEKTWRKANPNYGITVKPEHLGELAKQAAVSGSAESNFRRKHLNQWVGQESSWIPLPTWDKCRSGLPSPVFDESLVGQECFAGLDLGWRDDFACLGYTFPKRVKIEQRIEHGKNADDEQLAEAAPMATARWKILRCGVKLHCWVPSEGRRDITQAPLCNWIRDGLVTVVPGNTNDPQLILSQLERDRKTYHLIDLALDPNNARQFGLEAMELGLSVFEFWQTKRNYNEPCREFERLAAAGLLEHDGNPLLRWMIGNVVMEADARGYVMPAKQKSADKIDGPVALLMGFARAMFGELETGSVYERRGMIVL